MALTPNKHPQKSTNEAVKIQINRLSSRFLNRQINYSLICSEKLSIFPHFLYRINFEFRRRPLNTFPTTPHINLFPIPNKFKEETKNRLEKLRELMNKKKED